MRTTHGSALRAAMLARQANQKRGAKSGGACDTAGAGEGRKRKMAKKSRLTNAAKKIGAAIGRADRTAHKVAKAGVMAKGELRIFEAS